jgi:DMSO/TMAO reductase YedYZ molybdopterin-dependent catalytic subunit
LLADSANGVRLPAKPDFPFILAVEDKWRYKWERWIEHIELPAKADYRGFWEKRGFNHQGDRSGPELEKQLG